MSRSWKLRSNDSLFHSSKAFSPATVCSTKKSLCLMCHWRFVAYWICLGSKDKSFTVLSSADKLLSPQHFVFSCYSHVSHLLNGGKPVHCSWENRFSSFLLNHSPEFSVTSRGSHLLIHWLIPFWHQITPNWLNWAQNLTTAIVRDGYYTE